jgi:hypothetical protein
MPKNDVPVTMDELRRRTNLETITRSQLESLLRRRRIRSTHRTRQGRRRRLIYLTSTRDYLSEHAEAIRSRRTTVDPWEDENGVWWLPVGPLAGTFGDNYPTRALLAKWHAYGCYLLPDGRKLIGQILLAAGRRGDVDSLIPTLFVQQDDWGKVKTAAQSFLRRDRRRPARSQQSESMGNEVSRGRRTSTRRCGLQPRQR